MTPLVIVTIVVCGIAWVGSLLLACASEEDIERRIAVVTLAALTLAIVTLSITLGVMA